MSGLSAMYQVSFDYVLGLFRLCIRSLLTVYQVSFELMIVELTVLSRSALPAFSKVSVSFGYVLDLF